MDGSWQEDNDGEKLKDADKISDSPRNGELLIHSRMND